MTATTMTVEEFKVTELGPLPPEWEVVLLRDVVTFSRKPRNLDVATYDQVPFVPMEYIPDDHVDINCYEMKKPVEIGTGTFFYKGDLLVAKITPSFENGKQCIANDLPCDFGYATTEVWPLHKTDRVDLLYLFYYLRRKEIRTDVAGKMEGSTGRQRVPRRVLETLPIPLPPLSEQKRIAYFLSTVQTATEKTEAVIRTTRELKKSLMKHLFTYGPVSIDEAENVPLKETEIGMVPEEWEEKRLLDLAKKESDIVGGPFGSNLKVSDYTESGVPIIRLQNIKRNRFVKKDIKFVSKEKAEELEYHSFRAGDIVLAKLGDPIGKTCTVPDDLIEGIVVADVVRIRTDPELTSKDYIVYALNADFTTEQFRRLKTGTTRPRVNVSDVRYVKLPLPPITDQRRIASILSEVDRKIEVEEDREKALEALSKTLLSNLMTGKIRVNSLEVPV